MKIAVANLTEDPRTSATMAGDCRRSFEIALGRVIDRVAPLWPLDRFVAVNPFLGLSDRSFADAACMLGRVAGARMTMPRSYYRDAIATGLIERRDLVEALEESDDTEFLPRDVVHLLALVDGETEAPRALPMPSELARTATGFDWPSFIVERISSWAARCLGQREAMNVDSGRDGSLWSSWRSEAMIDRGPELAGLRNFRSHVAALPEDALDFIHDGVRRLGFRGAATPAQAQLHLHRLLMTVGGWAAALRRLEREGQAGLVRDLIAIRLAWETAILDGLAGHGLDAAWDRARRDYLGLAQPSCRASLALDLVLQSALEKARRRERTSALVSGKLRSGRSARRPRAQAVFCIDVRSEVFRRNLESVAPDIETFGFAGFFGLPIEFRALGQERGQARCPVLISPRIGLRETSSRAEPEAARREVCARQDQRERARTWTRFKQSAVSSFAFVETFGIGSAFSLIAASLGRRRGARTTVATTALEDHQLGEEARRLTPREGADLAEAALRGMSLTSDFAEIVLIVGHGSSSTNNLHASGLDCGACGGHAGDLNARLAARMFNDRAIRRDLAERGIEIPEQTIFIPALHDTTADEVVLLEASSCPPERQADLTRLRADLAGAGARARQERAARFGIAAHESLAARGRDWSEIRPEWGLVGCSSFIAAPRARSLAADLGGRAFLHSYDWKSDTGFAVLEQIMTAPMIVASWINLQYYASTVDNCVFGCGDKTLHDAVGSLGVIEGYGGDLRVGLPWQSLHDGENYCHEALRLDVVIEAPRFAIDAIIARHEELQRLFHGGWLHLFAIDEDGLLHRYQAENSWRGPSAGADLATVEEKA